MKFRKLLTLITTLAFVAPLGLFTTVEAVPLGPDKYFFELGEDEIKNEQLRIYGRENLANTQKVYVYVLGMRKVGEENDREFYEVDENDKSEVANWINLEFSEIQLTAGQTLIMNWSIQRQGTPKCGTNLAAIVVSTAPAPDTKEGALVAIRNEVVSQVHVNINNVDGVECKNKAELNLLDFKVKDKKSLFWSPDVPLETRIKNDGDIIGRSPKGFIEITGYGDKVTLPFNDDNLDIYPGTVRKFDNLWLDENYPKDGNFFKKLMYEATHLRIGRYKATLGVSKNINPQIVATTSFWIIPWRLILTLMLVILLILVLVYRNIRDKREIKNLKNSSKRL